MGHPFEKPKSCPQPPLLSIANKLSEAPIWVRFNFVEIAPNSGVSIQESESAHQGLVSCSREICVSPILRTRQGQTKLCGKRSQVQRSGFRGSAFRVQRSGFFKPCREPSSCPCEREAPHSPHTHTPTEALAKPPSSVLQAQYSEARSQYSESEPIHSQRVIRILTPEF